MRLHVVGLVLCHSHGLGSCSVGSYPIRPSRDIIIFQYCYHFLIIIVFLYSKKILPDKT
jgi:hypothetical protein